MIRQCCQCKRIWNDNQWVAPETLTWTVPLAQQDVSHGYCEDCFTKQMRIIHQLGKLSRMARQKPANTFFF